MLNPNRGNRAEDFPWGEMPSVKMEAVGNVVEKDPTKAPR
jgi:hypothetical protein